MILPSRLSQPVHRLLMTATFYELFVLDKEFFVFDVNIETFKQFLVISLIKILFIFDKSRQLNIILCQCFLILHKLHIFFKFDFT